MKGKPIWDPVPPVTWSMPIQPDWESFGAVILEDRIDFGVAATAEAEFIFRARVFNERGRKVAETVKFPPLVKWGRGRVCYPDGTQVEFDKDHGLQEKTFVGIGGVEVKRTILVPEGITTDCLFEFRFKVDLSTLELFGMTRINVGNPYPTLETVYRFGSLGEWVVNVSPGTYTRPVESKKDGLVQLSFFNVEASRTWPYTIPSNQQNAGVTLYSIPRSLRHACNLPYGQFWQEAVEKYWKPSLERDFPEFEKKRFYNRGRGFDQWVKKEPLKPSERKTLDAFWTELTQHLPAGDQEKAKVVHRRLQSRITNWSHPTFTDREFLSSKQWSTDDFSSDDFLLALDRGGTHSRGLTHLFIHALWRAGIRPKVMMVTDRFKGLFNYSSRNINQFSWILVKVEEPGRPDLWFDLDSRKGGPGLIDSRNQGVAGIEFDTREWKAAVGKTPQLDADSSQSDLEMECRPESQGRYSVKFRLGYKGLEDLSQRSRIRALPPEEFENDLKQRFQNPFALSIQSVKVENLDSQEEGMIVAGTGSFPVLGSETKILDLFPLEITFFRSMPMPEINPKLPFFLGNARTVHIRGHFAVPENHTPERLESWKRENLFGSIQWKAEFDSSTRVVHTSLDLVYHATPIPSEREVEFRQFAFWLDTIQNMKLALRRLP